VDNVPPVAVDDPGTTCQPQGGGFGGSFPIAEDYGPFDFAGSCSAIANDTDSDGSIVAWEVVTAPGRGTLEWLASFPGIFRYRVAANYNTPAGDWISDSFTYRVVDNLGAVSNIATMRFWIAPINDAPSFLTIPTVEVAEDSGPYSESWLPYVSAGPPDEAWQTVSFPFTSTQSSPPNLFSASPTFTSDGRLTFTPAPNQSGTAQVSVYLRDNGGLEDYGFPNMPVPPDDESGPFTFTIRVIDSNRAPVANGDTATIAEDSGPSTIDVLANDTDPDGNALTVLATTQGTKGQVVIAGGGTAVTYRPNANATGSDTFTYTIGDGEGRFAVGTVSVLITAVNDAPVAADDVATVDEDSGASMIDVRLNDTDIDGGTLRVIATTDGAKGTVGIPGDGPWVLYTPNTDANGSDSFTYTVSDGNGGTDTATVAVTITPVNDPPDAADDGIPTPIRIARGSGPVSIGVLANDTTGPDDAETLQITSVTQGSQGTVAIEAGGLSLTYDPAGQTTGLDVFTYTISDGHGGFDTATVRVEVAKIKPPR
jgi:large repetitive protein